MKTLKIYGINGLLEWHGTLNSNGIRMKVDFTNGSTTAYGVAPATFMTKDEVTQNVVENSNEFKSGRIKLLRTVPLEKEEPAKSKEEAKSTTKEYPEVTGTQKAKEVLQNEYGYDTSQIRSKADAHEAAKKYGISFPNLH